MNAQQMQAYRPYAQGQQRGGVPASRRPGSPGIYISPMYSQSSPAQLQKMAYPPSYLQRWGLPTPAQTPLRPVQYQEVPSGNMVPYFQSVQGHYLPSPAMPMQYHPVYNGSHVITGQVPATAQQYAAQQAHLQQQRQQQAQAVLEHQHAQRRAKKPTDKNMPDGIEDMIIGEGVQQYKELREQERRLDYAIMRKRLDLTDSFNRSNKRQKTLRIWVSNTAENQHWQKPDLETDAFDFTTTEQSTARIKIEGRIIDDPDEEVMDSDDEGEDKPNPVKTAPQKMSHFFKSMSVEYDKHRNNVPDPGWQVDWKKQPGSEVDEVCFRRPCDENVNININLTRDENPEKFKLSPILAETLDMAEGDRPEVVMGIWEYVKCMNLQEDEDKRMVRCDDQLRQIFGVEQIYFPQIPDRIMPHLHPLDPIKLPYTVRVDQEYCNDPKPTVYDIRVTVEDPLKARVMAMMQNQDLRAGLTQIAQLDEQLAVIVQALQHSKARHTFFKSMSKDPGGFVNKWVKSQRRDLEVILGEAARGGGEDATGPEFAKGGKDGVWGSEPVHEAVRYMLAKPQAGKV